MLELLPQLTMGLGIAAALLLCLQVRGGGATPEPSLAPRKQWKRKGGFHGRKVLAGLQNVNADGTYTRAELAEVLNVTPGCVGQWLKKGLRGTHCPDGTARNLYLFDGADVLAFFNNNTHNNQDETENQED